MAKLVDVKKHYDMLIEEGIDFVHDKEVLKNYNRHWDGEEFIDALELNSSKKVLEVGVGTGRVAIEVLKKEVGYFEGIDISHQSIQKALINLREYVNKINLKAIDIKNYKEENKFDVAYSVLTFIHIEDKVRALKNMIKSLKNGGKMVISITKDPSEYLDYNSRVVRLYPATIEYYQDVLIQLGCKILLCKDLNSFASIIKAQKMGL